MMCKQVLIGLGAVLALGAGAAAAYSIPEAQLDKQKIYYGMPSKFDKAGEVDYEEVIKATPEFQEVKKKKVERGSGKYWILLSQASDRAVRIITKVGDETEYDLIAAKGYLGGLNPAIPVDDITETVVKAMHDDTKSEKS